ncbi:FecR domain-containing protein, partial [Candidatus Peregrinibacteria bacterium]|nr:FecR domain-containing protein [Candidatus Peregrinibacteria bacterium]
MPFLIIICVGIIVVLLFNLWGAVFGNKKVYGANLHMVSGSASMKTWNTNDFFNLTSDALVLQGDEIRTSSDAKVIMEFFDGTIVRVGGGSDLVLTSLDDSESSPAIDVLLVNGQVWFNKVYKNSKAVISVTTDATSVKSIGSDIFEVENLMDKVVRVVYGDPVKLDILKEDGGKAVETETVGVGQEIIITKDVLAKYRQFQSPSVLMALSDE